MVWRVTPVSGQEPRDWQVEHYADIGTSEEFIQQLVLEMNDLIGGTLIPEPQRAEAKGAILTISLEGLMPAFQHLKRIRTSVGRQLPILDRQQLYEDFTRVLWHGYKDLMPRAIKLMGFDIGFLFQNDKDFKKGIAEFERGNPTAKANFGAFLRAQRDNWQSALAKFRNHYLEHREDERGKFVEFYKPQNAEALFQAVWRTIADILFMCVEMTLPPGFSIREIPQSERTGNPPRRFQIMCSHKLALTEEPKGSREIS